MTVAYQSHLGVYAFVLNDAQDSVLLIKKALGCYTGLYDLPGGTMEPHEVLEETLFREVLEETDCTIVTAAQLATFSVLYPYVDQGQDMVLRHLGVIYTAAILGTPRVGAGVKSDDSLGCVWVPLVDVSNGNSAPFVLDAIRKTREAS